MAEFKAFLKKLGSGIADTLRSFPCKENIVRLVCLIVGAAILMSLALVTVSASVKSFGGRYVTEEPTGEYGCIIVLGTKVNGDGSLSERLSDRVDTAVSLYMSGAASLILMSGDGEDPSEYDEPSAMKAYAVAAGVPEEDIITDRYGLSTYDSIWRAKNVYKTDNFIVVTQEYHLFRAMYIAAKLGCKDCCGVAADARSYDRIAWYELRDAVARVKDFFFVRHEHTPEYTE